MTFAPTLMLPKSCWDKTNNLVRPCDTERAVLMAILNTLRLIRSHEQNVNNKNIDDKLYIETIAKTIWYRTENINLSEISGVAEYLASICKEIGAFDTPLVVKLFDYYNVHGTEEIDNVLEYSLDPKGDISFKFFLYFIDIKVAVHYLITSALNATNLTKPQLIMKLPAQRQVKKKMTDSTSPQVAKKKK